MARILYTVKPGDTLYLIAQRYGISPEQLKEANLMTSDIIYVGQKLFIPVQYYIVKPGDTLYTIANRFNTTVESIIKLNNLTSPMLMIGQRLQIPLYTEVVVNVDSANVRMGPGYEYPVMTKMAKGARLPVFGVLNNWYKVGLFDGGEGWISRDIVNTYVYGGEDPISTILGFYTLEEGPTLPSSYDSFVNNADVLSEIGLFTYRISAENPTEIEKFGDFTDEYIDDIVNIAHRQNISVLPVVHNLLYPGVNKMVSSKQNRDALIQNIIELIEKYDFDGVNIDIEDVNLEDSENLSKFYTELGMELDKKGYILSASVPSRVSDEPFNPFSDPFDYGKIGEAVDEFVVMLYNEHGWPGSPPGPAVSIGWMERVLNYTMTKMPKEKIVAAVSVFGFDFNLTTGKNTYVTYQMAMDLAQKYDKEVMFDEETKTPMFSYVDEEGNEHEVWFENEESIKAKIDLAWKLGIKGIALWRLGMEDPEMWNMLREDVVVKKF